MKGQSPWDMQRPVRDGLEDWKTGGLEESWNLDKFACRGRGGRRLGGTGLSNSLGERG
jgi:hypothetical protein